MAGLLSQGIVMMVLGMALVFAALAGLWALITLLTRAFPGAADTAPGTSAGAADEAPRTDEGAAHEAQRTSEGAADDHTAERARVAAVVAGALMANALPLLLAVPPGPNFEHGRSAPSWVTSNRSRAVRAWQPPRAKVM